MKIMQSPYHYSHRALKPVSSRLQPFTKPVDQVVFAGKPKVFLDPAPLKTLFNQVESPTLEEAQHRYADQPQFLETLNQVAQLGYSKQSYPQLRQQLLNPNGTYDLAKLATLLRAAVGQPTGSVPAIREQQKDTTWFYNECPMVEYLNIRALGVNQADGKPQRSGNLLDGIVYALQSRAGAFHVAPFHASGFMDQVYCPKDTYTLDPHLISPELTQLGLNPRGQMKLFADVCHRLKQPIALFYDTLPHTGDISVNYLDTPEAARWIALQPKAIQAASQQFNQGMAVLQTQSPQTQDAFNQSYRTLCQTLNRPTSPQVNPFLESQLSLLQDLITGDKPVAPEALSPELKEALKRTLPGKSTQHILENGKSLLSGPNGDTAKAYLFALTLRKELVLATRMAEEDIDIVFLRDQSERIWRTGTANASQPMVEATTLIQSKDHVKIAKKIRRLVKDHTGKSKPTYEDIQQGEQNYQTSLKRRLMETERIYNMPVGAWNGLIPELVGFHQKYHYPIFSCRGNSQTNSRYQTSNTFKDVAWKMFGTLSRRRFNLSDGQENRAAVTDLKDTITFWLDTGFDGLRLDQTDHLFTKPYDYQPQSGQHFETYLASKDYAYDTMLPTTLNNLISRLKKSKGQGMPVFIENMMYHASEHSQRAFSELKALGADAMIGNFQFLSDLPSLLKRVTTHNRMRQMKDTNVFLLGTIESHDNQLSGRDLGPAELKGQGTGPASLAMDGLSRLRMRFLLNAVGLPYVTTQAYNGIHSQKQKSSQIQDTVLQPINLDFDTLPPTYQVGDRTYNFNDFKHNFMDWINRPEIRPILKGGQLFPIESSSGAMAFQIRNTGNQSLLVVANTGNTLLQPVELKDLPNGFNLDQPQALRYPLDGHHLTTLTPVADKLPFTNKNTLTFPKLDPGEIQLFLINE